MTSSDEFLSQYRELIGRRMRCRYYDNSTTHPSSRTVFAKFRLLDRADQEIIEELIASDTDDSWFKGLTR